jgi:UDP-N-acetylmuramoylalanine--D-glutamate ligase
MSHYIASKANILRYQSGRDTAVLGVDNAVTGRWWREGRIEVEAGAGQGTLVAPISARRVGFSLREPVSEGAFLGQRGQRLIWRDGATESEICGIDELQLLGRHNVANVLAACAIAGVAGATREAMRQVATTFRGVAHRLELVRELNGVRWYNDSIATSPERVVAALKSFDAPLTLLAGGRDKHLPWQEMADLALERVRHLVLFGEAADLIADALAAARARAAGGDTLDAPEVYRCLGLDDAVQVAARVAKRGAVVLLSPGGTSFDAYKDFEERGEHFCRLVEELA